MTFPLNQKLRYNRTWLLVNDSKINLLIFIDGNGMIKYRWVNGEGNCIYKTLKFCPVTLPILKQEVGVQRV